MRKIDRMSRTLSDEYKLQGNSLPEIRRAWEQAVLDLKDEVRDVAGSLRPGNLLNAFVLHCLIQSPQARLEIARFGLRAFEFLKDRDQPVDLTRTSPEDFRAMAGLLDQVVAATPAQGARSREIGRKKTAKKRTG